MVWNTKNTNSWRGWIQWKVFIIEAPLRPDWNEQNKTQSPPATVSQTPRDTTSNIFGKPRRPLHDGVYRSIARVLPLRPLETHKKVLTYLEGWGEQPLKGVKCRHMDYPNLSLEETYLYRRTDGATRVVLTLHDLQDRTPKRSEAPDERWGVPVSITNKTFFSDTERDRRSLQKNDEV